MPTNFRWVIIPRSYGAAAAPSRKNRILTRGHYSDKSYSDEGAGAVRSLPAGEPDAGSGRPRSAALGVSRVSLFVAPRGARANARGRGESAGARGRYGAVEERGAVGDPPAGAAPAAARRQGGPDRRTRLHGPASLDQALVSESSYHLHMAAPFDPAQDRPFDPAQERRRYRAGESIEDICR